MDNLLPIACTCYQKVHLTWLYSENKCIQQQQSNHHPWQHGLCSSERRDLLNDLNADRTNPSYTSDLVFSIRNVEKAGRGSWGCTGIARLKDERKEERRDSQAYVSIWEQRGISHQGGEVHSAGAWKLVPPRVRKPKGRVGREVRVGNHYCKRDERQQEQCVLTCCNYWSGMTE